MYKTLLLLLISLSILGCNSETQEGSSIQTANLNLNQYSPESKFDQCLDIKTYQLLAAAKTHLETFIKSNLITKNDDIATGYQLFCLAWTGQVGAEMNTKTLLGNDVANTFYTHPNFKDIWVQLTELGDTVYTEELAYDENGNGVVVKFIENYYTLNTNGSYYKCLDKVTDAYIQNYLINKEYGNTEPQDFAFEFYNSIELEQYNDPMIQNIIITELYLRLIAIRNKG